MMCMHGNGPACPVCPPRPKCGFVGCADPRCVPVPRPPIRRIYLIGSLRNENVPLTAARLREHGYEVFDDWYAAGKEADDYLYAYEKSRGRTCAEAIYGAAATNAFEFDKRNIDASDTGVLLMPAGKSGHLELGYMLGKGKRGYVVLDKEPERIDLMYGFADGVVMGVDALVEALKKA